MRVLMVSAAVLPVWKCGVATVVEDIRSMLKKNGHEVALFALDLFGGNDRVEYHENTQCWFTKTNVSQKCAYISDSLPTVAHVNERFKACLELFQPDAVHFHTPQYFSLSLIRMAKEIGARTVVTLHDWWWVCPTQFFTPEKGCRCESVSRDNCLKCMKNTGETEDDYEKRISALKDVEALVDCFTCVSPVLYNDIINAKPDLRPKICIIPNAVPKSAESFVEMEGPLVFVFLGGRAEIKGYYEVMDAFGKIPNTEEWRLEIYGCSVPFQIGIIKWMQYVRYIFHPVLLFRKIKYIVQPRRRLRAFRDRLFGRKGSKRDNKELENVQRIFHYPSITSQERDEILRRSHVVLMCSQVQESFSLVTYEAMANGCCVISTPCSGPMSIIKDQINGIILSDSKPETLTNAVLYMLMNRNKVEYFRHNAYEESKSFLGKEQIANLYSELYSEEHVKHDC